MDKEIQSSRRNERASCNKLGLLVVAAVVLCIVFSSVAVVISALTYYNYQVDMRVGIVNMEDDHSWMREAIAELELTFEREGLMSFSKHHKNRTHPDEHLGTDRPQRDVTDRDEAEYNEMCNSTNASGHYNSIPIAHIVPMAGHTLELSDSTKKRNHAPAVVASKQWVCGRRPRDYEFGVIAGGMVFNRSSGSLILPTDGVYYVYSHVQLRLMDTDKTFETLARMVACVPGEECEMLDKHSLPPLLQSSDTASPFDNRLSPFEAGQNGIYQGGLFHFKANTRITLLARNPKWQAVSTVKRGGNKLSITDASYMGAFLVQGMPFNSPNV